MAPPSLSIPLHFYPLYFLSPLPTSCHCGTLQLILGKVPAHPVLSWIPLECAFDLRRDGGAVGLPFRVSPSRSQGSALSQAGERGHTCSSAQMDLPDDLVLLQGTPAWEVLVGENLGAGFWAAG